MGIKWLQAEDRIVIRRRANPHRQHPSEKIAWRESSTLPSSSPCSSRRYIRSAQRKSDRDRSKIPIVEKPSAVKLTLENVTILKRETAATNLQSTENPMVDVATDRCPTNKSSTDFEDLQKDIPMVNRNPQFYAGPGFFSSPPPSSLPRPTSLFEKKEVTRSFSLFSL